MVNLTLSLHNIMDLNLESLAFVMAISSSNLLLKKPGFYSLILMVPKDLKLMHYALLLNVLAGMVI